jgi:hypothetical protein
MDSSVGVATDYELNDWGSIPDGQNFSLFHPASYSIGIMGTFPYGKAAGV